MSGKTLSMKKIERMKAKAVKASDEDYEKEIRLKEKERIRRQRDFKRTFLSRLFQEEVLNEMKIQITAEQAFKKDYPNKDSTCIKIQWMGMAMPLTMLIREYNLQIDRYREICLQEKYLLEALKNDGLTDKEIETVVAGEFIKEKNEGKLNKKKSKPDIDYVG